MLTSDHGRPNVLLISTDHWPASLLGVAGHPSIQTPTLDQMAHNGIRFTNAYTECPICIPARRTLMTGTTPRTHGDRTFMTDALMPDLPTVAQTFRDAGYQAQAVGKLHVFPQRDRIGFDDVILAEEGRPQLGTIDDHEMFLADEGYAGQAFTHGMTNNDYVNRPWHLPEYTHVTNWTTQQMARQIKRRDPRRPAFWFLSYCHPHPPLAPLQCYLDMYRDVDPEPRNIGPWSFEPSLMPYLLQRVNAEWDRYSDHEMRQIKRAFYALCTHIDHQIRVILGTLREEEELDNTIIMFTSDHGDMLGDHGLWAKRLFYENAANIPMILMGTAGDERVGHHRVDNRLVGWQDVMPTLLDLAGLEIPDTVDGISMIGAQTREYIYGECAEGPTATRMIHDGRHKLIYYPTGNHVQLFDTAADPEESMNLADDPQHADLRQQLTGWLLDELYGTDEAWVQNGALIGLPDLEYTPGPSRGFGGQRGLHWPPPPLDLSGRVVGAPWTEGQSVDQ
ncbi:MAG: sulfatase-like hydrolase/transferase [Chloroflexota bacterium]